MTSPRLRRTEYLLLAFLLGLFLFRGFLPAWRSLNTDFRNYYGLRASVSFSLGSHDEWNIIRAINEKRRASKDGEGGFGVARQIAVLFNGTGIAPGLFDASTQAGDEGKCPLPK